MEDIYYFLKLVSGRISKKLIFTFLFCILSLNLLKGQNLLGTIEGYLTDSTGVYLDNVNIQVKGTSLGTITNTAGYFNLKGVPKGRHILKVSMVGFKPHSLPVEVQAGKTTKVEIILKYETIRLKEVVFSSGAPFKKDIPSPTLRLAQPIIEIPQNIVIISRAIIKDQQLLTLSEIEKNVSGVSTNFPYPGVFTDFMIRGSRADKNKFRNGILSSVGAQLMEDMSFVDHVELVKGPAGFMISQGEPGGIYNVYTKKPQRDMQNEVSLTYGSFNLMRGSVDVGGAVKEGGRLLYRINAMGQRSNTHIDFDHNNRVAFAPALTYEISPKTKLTAEYNYQHAKMGIVEPSVFASDNFSNLPINFTYYDPSGEGVKITDHTVYLNLEHQINPDWKITAQMGHSRGRWFGNRFDFGFGPDFEIVDEEGNMYREYRLQDVVSGSTSGQLFLNGNVKTGVLTHNLIVGLDANENSMMSTRTSESVAAINIYNPEYSLEELPALSLDGVAPYKEATNYSALYVQDMISVFDDLRLTFAGRYTSANILNSDEGYQVENITAFSPRLGLSYSIYKNLAVYALYDQSFVPQSGITFNNDPIKPLRGNNIEAGIKKDWLRDKISTNLSVYHITKINKLTTDPLNPDFQIQRGEIQSKGIELDVLGSISDQLSLVFNYAFTDSKITEDTDESIKGQRVDGVARNAANFWIKYQFTESWVKGLGVSFGGRYLSGRAALPDYADTKFPLLDDWKQLDAGLNYQLENFRFSFNINNITNEKNYTGIPMTSFGAYYTQFSPPTNYRITTSINF